jgi:ankyrin repeat protein
MSAFRIEVIPDLLRAIEEASATGNLQEVKALFQRWSTIRATSLELGESIPPEIDEHLETALSEAAKNGHAAVVSYLLDQGIKITNSVMTGVKEGKSESVFQALLDHGWDINSKWWLDITTLWYLTRPRSRAMRRATDD